MGIALFLYILKMSNFFIFWLNLDKILAKYDKEVILKVNIFGQLFYQAQQHSGALISSCEHSLVLMSTHMHL